MPTPGRPVMKSNEKNTTNRRYVAFATRIVQRSFRSIRANKLFMENKNIFPTISQAVAMGIFLPSCLFLLLGCAASGQRPAPQFVSEVHIAEADNPNTGPTLRLDYEEDGSPGNPIAAFMYFVPLISPVPVTTSQSSRNTQHTHVLSLNRDFSPHTFSVTCEFEIKGDGFQRNSFDYTDKIRRHLRRLKEGGSLKKQLDYIMVESNGYGTINVRGVVSEGVASVTELKMRFDGRGKPSPVTIGLHDFREVDGTIQPVDELVARVSSLTFQQTTDRPRMGVTVASVNRKGAGNNLWQKIKGNIVGVTANMLIKPISIEAVGHQTMLDFGLALSAQRRTFTFPKARNIQH